VSSPRSKVVHVTTMNAMDLLSHILGSEKPKPVRIAMKCGCKARFGAAQFSDDNETVHWDGPVYAWCEFHSANQCEDNAVRGALRELFAAMAR